MTVRYLSWPNTVKETRINPVKRKRIRIGKDPAAQNFASMFGVPTKLPGQDDEGYGAKITTDTQVRIGTRWYRVYATCWGNAASHWIMFQGSKTHL